MRQAFVIHFIRDENYQNTPMTYDRQTFTFQDLRKQNFRQWQHRSIALKNDCSVAHARKLNILIRFNSSNFDIIAPKELSNGGILKNM